MNDDILVQSDPPSRWQRQVNAEDKIPLVAVSTGHVPVSRVGTVGHLSTGRAFARTALLQQDASGKGAWLVRAKTRKHVDYMTFGRKARWAHNWAMSSVLLRLPAVTNRDPFSSCAGSMMHLQRTFLWDSRAESPSKLTCLYHWMALGSLKYYVKSRSTLATAIHIYSPH